jgi:hypothetical protein
MALRVMLDCLVCLDREVTMASQACLVRRETAVQVAGLAEMEIQGSMAYLDLLDLKVMLESLERDVRVQEDRLVTRVWMVYQDGMDFPVKRVQTGYQASQA